MRCGADWALYITRVIHITRYIYHADFNFFLNFCWFLLVPIGSNFVFLEFSRITSQSDLQLRLLLYIVGLQLVCYLSKYHSSVELTAGSNEAFRHRSLRCRSGCVNHEWG